jgi:hypothetical protein
MWFVYDLRIPHQDVPTGSFVTTVGAPKVRTTERQKDPNIAYPRLSKNER